MTEHDRRAPDPPLLGAAAEHRAAAEEAAARRDFDRALRERFRAVLRGMEQRGVLETRRSRTADETAVDASAVLPLEVSTELQPAAHSFDEVVYGGRGATEDEYRRLEYADTFSAAAPPPRPEPEVREVVEAAPRTRRRVPPLPALLRNPRFWAGLAAVLVLGLLLYAALHSCAAPTAPPPQPPPPDLPPPDDPDLPSIEGEDSIFSRLPAPLAYGGLQLLIAFALLIWWRARRRGALVREPRPVEVAANELLAGQAALYRRGGDHDYIAAKLRAATLRRIRPELGAAADADHDGLVRAVAARTGLDPGLVYAAMFAPVPDASALRVVAAQLASIETEVR
ncbi:DUF4129 domain-containing protein [Nocardia shimofusensis]|uniref:DUF4129 domain-containing protein n=1 Tax=Nocardia shimofusensis TaxID=228596 RepID=UPI00082F3183|nr:DUF4129 domain-containing protein [Nocardia shimofusensis]